MNQLGVREARRAPWDDMIGQLETLAEAVVLESTCHVSSLPRPFWMSQVTRTFRVAHVGLDASDGRDHCRLLDVSRQRQLTTEEGPRGRSRWAGGGPDPRLWLGQNLADLN